VGRDLRAVEGDEYLATYYADVFEADWSSDAWRFPIGLSATVVAALVVAAIVGRRYVRFGSPPSEYT
ncbi:MAG: phospholipase D-like domain-containing protein, partial [Natrinema limicola]